MASYGKQAKGQCGGSYSISAAPRHQCFPTHNAKGSGGPLSYSVSHSHLHRPGNYRERSPGT